MDNKFDEIEDIFDDELPVEDDNEIEIYPGNNEETNDNIESTTAYEEVPTYEEPIQYNTVEPLPEENVQEALVQNDVPTYENQDEMENDVQIEEEIPVYEEVKPVETQQEYQTYEEPTEYNTVDPLPEDNEQEVFVQNDMPTYENQETTENIDVQTEEQMPVYEEVKPVEPLQQENNEFLEHPDAKIELINEQKPEKNVDTKVEPIKLSDNKSLTFVIIVGIIILVAILLLPYIVRI